MIKENCIFEQSKCEHRNDTERFCTQCKVYQKWRTNMFNKCSKDGCCCILKNYMENYTRSEKRHEQKNK